jgi:DNA invertase Pin-like site-specific DNA recombinase
MQKERKMLVGYARVSTQGQSVADQIAALKAAGADKIYSEKMSGARTDRPQLGKAIAALQADDVLVVTGLDRLARSTLDLLNMLKTLADKGASFKSLADPWIDTTSATGRLMLTVLGGLAEFERSLIQARVGVGIARARAAGVKFGRPSKLNAHQRAEAIARREAGDPQGAIARTFGVDQSTISRLVGRRGEV